MSGFVLVDKPRGPTSHDVVDAVRRALHVKRVGHAGTLDPIATGLLVVAVGPATRLLRYAQGLPKTYDVTAMLGVRTTTLDAAGEIVSREPVDVTPEAVRSAVSRFVGRIEQTPPAVSAIKVDGERAYKRVARGEDVQLAPREVTVYSFDVLRTSPDAFDARVVCSTGTYVRSLVAEVGETLGCGAHVAHLRRIAIGELSVRDATKLEAVGASALRPIEAVLAHLPCVELDAEEARKAQNGQRIAADIAPGGEVLVAGPDGVVGVFECRDGILRPVTVLGTGT